MQSTLRNTICLGRRNLRSIIIAGGLVCALPVHAADRPYPEGMAPHVAGPYAVSGPRKPVYRIPGVTDNGSDSLTGFATVIHCTNASNVPESLGVVLRSYDGTQIVAKTFTLAKAQTFTMTTHNTALFQEDAFLSPGTSIFQGVAVISATTLHITCTAMILDASSAGPNGISLHMARFNPEPGTTE